MSSSSSPPRRGPRLFQDIVVRYTSVHTILDIQALGPFSFLPKFLALEALYPIYLRSSMDNKETAEAPLPPELDEAFYRAVGERFVSRHTDEDALEDTEVAPLPETEQ